MTGGFLCFTSILSCSSQIPDCLSPLSPTDLLGLALGLILNHISSHSPFSIAPLTTTPPLTSCPQDPRVPQLSQPWSDRRESQVMACRQDEGPENKRQRTLVQCPSPTGLVHAGASLDKICCFALSVGGYSYKIGLDLPSNFSY